MKLFAIVEKYPLTPRGASSEYYFTLKSSSFRVRDEKYGCDGDLEESIKHHRAKGTRVITSRRPFGLGRFYTTKCEIGGLPSDVTVIRIPLDEYKRTQGQFEREEQKSRRCVDIQLCLFQKSNFLRIFLTVPKYLMTFCFSFPDFV